jgi:hypothetical protein
MASGHTPSAASIRHGDKQFLFGSREYREVLGSWSNAEIATN